MKIFHSVTWDVPFVYLSIGYAIKNLSKYIDAEVILWDYHKEFHPHQIHPYHDECILIFEAGNIPHGNWTITELKQWFPKGKIVCLYSDTMWWMVNGSQQISDQHLVDLNLDLNSQCIEWMNNKRWLTDQWLWTCSELNIEQLKKICPQNKIDWARKRTDVIGVYLPSTISQPGYRNEMITFLQNHRCSFTQGGGTGHQDSDVDKIYNAYMDSYINLGTSSHGYIPISDKGTLKGWREWISPFLNCLLIHDNHPNVQNAYNKDGIVPTYTYGRFNEIIDLVYYYKNNFSIYESKLLKQREWAEKNTIEKQLTKLLAKYNLVSSQNLTNLGKCLLS